MAPPPVSESPVRDERSLFCDAGRPLVRPVGTAPGEIWQIPAPSKGQAWPPYRWQLAQRLGHLKNQDDEPGYEEPGKASQYDGDHAMGQAEALSFDIGDDVAKNRGDQSHDPNSTTPLQITHGDQRLMVANSLKFRAPRHVRLRPPRRDQGRGRVRARQLMSRPLARAPAKRLQQLRSRADIPMMDCSRYQAFTRRAGASGSEIRAAAPDTPRALRAGGQRLV